MRQKARKPVLFVSRVLFFLTLSWFSAPLMVPDNRSG
jgi:hypothetical protein